MGSQARFSHVATALLLLSSLTSTAVALSCYSHNGVEASSSEFYNATADGALIGCGQGATTCCLESQYCDVDLLCHDRSTGDVSRQYCSDPSWPADKCSALCPGYSAAGVALTACDDTNTIFCCGPDNTACCEAGNYTRINSAGLIIAIGTSTVPISSSTSTGTATSSSTGPASSAATTTAETAGASSAPAAASTSASKSTSGTSSSTKLGAGLGVGLGVPLLIALGVSIYFFARSSRNKNAASSAADDQQPADLYRYSGYAENKKDPREGEHMLANTRREELPGTSPAHELPS